METWKIFVLDDEPKPLYIEASSFDEAIEKARKIDERYYAGMKIDE